MTNSRFNFFSAGTNQHHCSTWNLKRVITSTTSSIISTAVIQCIEYTAATCPRELYHQLSHSQDENEFLQGFNITLLFLFPGSSSSVLPAARDYPYPRQQEAKHSLFHRGVGACGTNRTQTAFGVTLSPWEKDDWCFLRLACSCAGEFQPSVLLLFVNQRLEGMEKNLLVLVAPGLSRDGAVWSLH